MFKKLIFPLSLGLAAAVGILVWQPWNPTNKKTTQGKTGSSVPPRTLPDAPTHWSRQTARIASASAADTTPAAPLPTGDETSSTADELPDQSPDTGQAMAAGSGSINTSRGTFVGGSPRIDMDPQDSTADLEMPPAIRLSENFRLPAVFLALDVPASKGGLAGRSKQVRGAAQAIVDNFYREVAKQVARTNDWQKDLETEPETGDSTYVVEPGTDFEPIRRAADEKFRLLFGDDSYNAYLVRSGTERMLESMSNSPLE